MEQDNVASDRSCGVLGAILCKNGRAIENKRLD
jgi:hypothetical protein